MSVFVDHPDPERIAIDGNDDDELKENFNNNDDEDGNQDVMKQC